MKKSELRKLIRNVIKEVISEQIPPIAGKDQMTPTPPGPNIPSNMGFNCAPGGICMPVPAEPGVNPGVYATFEECSNSCIAPPPPGGGGPGMPGQTKRASIQAKRRKKGARSPQRRKIRKARR